MMKREGGLSKKLLLMMKGVWTPPKMAPIEFQLSLLELALK